MLTPMCLPWQQRDLIRVLRDFPLPSGWIVKIDHLCVHQLILYVEHPDGAMHLAFARRCQLPYIIGVLMHETQWCAEGYARRAPLSEETAVFLEENAYICAWNIWSAAMGGRMLRPGEPAP